MNYLKILFISILAVLFANIHSFGQGCSDAGFCSMGSIKSSQNNDTLHAAIGISQNIGMGEEGVLILSTQLEFKLMPWNNGLISVKAPYTFVSGNLGSVNGPGDLTISYTHKIIEDDDYYVMLNLGGKIPSNASDKRNKADKPLPMGYQISLGTTDLIIGASLFHQEWHFAIGYQHAFNRNENGFLHSIPEWAGDINAEEYFESNKFKRGDDIMLRIEKRFEKPNVTYFAGILPIYRIQKDEIIDNGKTIALDGSSSVTINLNGGLLYKLSNQTDLNISMGVPTLFRRVRADGLTRLFSLTVGIEKKFR